MKASRQYGWIIGPVLLSQMTAAGSPHPSAQRREHRVPAVIYYAVRPNRYLTDHAADLKRWWDGFFFNVGSWEDAKVRFEGSEAEKPKEAPLLDEMARNLASLRRAGITENFLTVSFPQDGDWPSPKTLLSPEYSQRMASDFGTLGRVAHRLGFRGVAVDLEYPYERYSITHSVYTYDGYTVGDLLRAARRQGYRNTLALLDAFPDAALLILPGELATRPIGREYMIGLMQAMCSRQAPGGFHFATEYTYCLQDGVSNLAACRSIDCSIEAIAGPAIARYWRRRGSVAPGVWPLHMVETGGKDYPVQPWAKEVKELRDQFAVLNTAARRWMWVFSGQPIWYQWSAELEQRYGLTRPRLGRQDVDPTLFRDILVERPQMPAASPLRRLLHGVFRLDAGRLKPEELCDLFGTPGKWWVLGLLAHPDDAPQFAAPEATFGEPNPHPVYHGRDSAVRWFQVDNLDPRGITSGRYHFDYRNIAGSSAHFACAIYSPTRRRAVLNVAWDSGIIVRIGGRMVFASGKEPPQILYRDKYRFAKRVPIILPKGRSAMVVTCLNSHGRLTFALRITNEQGIPIPGVHFRLD
ncbi:MAG: hypothetical protein ACP5VE_10025 [Chthonomonadales bacterium]